MSSDVIATTKLSFKIEFNQQFVFDLHVVTENIADIVEMPSDETISFCLISILQNTPFYNNKKLARIRKSNAKYLQHALSEPRVDRLRPAQLLLGKQPIAYLLKKQYSCQLRRKW
jgi:hypothetical protein